MVLEPGTTLGPYEIIACVGAGGMGEVYRARDRRLQRMVAVKVLASSVVQDPERLKRFKREAHALASLNHPNIAQVHGLEEATVADGRRLDALVMEYVDGEPLDKQLARGPLPLASAVDIARQVIEALDASHTAGIVHRDLKPANICVTRDGGVKLVDFGLAKTVAAQEAAAETATVDATRAGSVVGTPRYMSPEQARGLATDKRTDVWAFGCVLFELVSGKPAFDGPTWSDTLAAVLEKTPDWSKVAGAPPRLRELLMQCLEKDPKARLRDIADARASLEIRTATAADSPRRAGRWLAVVPWALAVGLAVALIAVGSSRGPVSPIAPQYGRMARLTTGPTVELGPAISPDGQWVAFFSNDSARTDILVKYLAGGETVNLTASSGLELPTRIDIGGMAISPDGSHIAFDAGARLGTPSNLFDSWIIPAPLGGNARKLVERGRGLRWSPDGKRIAYIRAGAAAGDSVWVADADGTNERQLVAAHGGIHFHWLSWAHDSAAVYFIHTVSTSNSGPAEIYRVPLPGGPIEAVITTARRAVFPIPLPDGNGILYAANPDTSDLGLWWRRPGDPSSTQRITSGIGEIAEPSLSRDGRRVVATLIEWNQSVMRLALNGTVAQAVPVFPAEGSGDLDPAVSPDGQRLVFSSARSGGRTLWLSGVDGSRPRPLTSGSVFDERPSFSSDGTRIAFVSDRGERRGIWVMSADGGAPRLVTHAVVLDTVSWSPDSKELVYAAGAGAGPGLWIVDVTNGATRRLDTSGPATGPVWSSRGLIAYIEARAATRDTPNSSRIGVIDSAGRVLDVGGGSGPNVLNGFLAWSPDGRHLAAFVDPGAAANSVWVADIDRNGPFQRVYEAPQQVRFRGAAWMPGAQAMIVGQMRRSSDVVMMERVTP